MYVYKIIHMRHVLSPTNTYTQNTLTNIQKYIQVGVYVIYIYIYIYQHTHTWCKDKNI